MLGFKSKDNNPTGFAHICSGGSIANLESLWFARELQFIPLIIKEFWESFKQIVIEFINGWECHSTGG